jgi:hypothetical protein
MAATTLPTGCTRLAINSYSSPIAADLKRLRAASRSAILNRLTLFEGLIWATSLDLTQLVSVLTDTPRYLAAAAVLR